MGSTKEKLLRTLDILNETDENHPITTAGIIERLNLMGLEPERKSVQRDIALLKHCGYDIVLADDNKQGFYMASRKFDDWEIKVLIDAVESFTFINDKDSDALIEKLCSLTSASTGDMFEEMVFPTSGKIISNQVKYAIDTIVTCIRKGKKVKFEYVYMTPFGETVPKFETDTKPVSPYSLIIKDGEYYLIGNYDANRLSYYHLDRVRNIEETDEPIRPLRDILGNSARSKLRTFVYENIYAKKGEEVRIHLGLKRNAYEAVLETLGNDRVTFIPESDGTISANVNVADSDGLYRWLMLNSDKFYVLGPESVKNELVRRLEEMLGQYK